MMTPAEQAQQAMAERHAEERGLAEAYARLFATKDGEAVLADLQTMFPVERSRFDAHTTKANPLAAIIGGIHFDGSATVMQHILSRIESARAHAPTPNISAP